MKVSSISAKGKHPATEDISSIDLFSKRPKTEESEAIPTQAPRYNYCRVETGTASESLLDAYRAQQALPHAPASSVDHASALVRVIDNIKSKAVEKIRILQGREQTKRVQGHFRLVAEIAEQIQSLQHDLSMAERAHQILAVGNPESEAFRR